MTFPLQNRKCAEGLMSKRITGIKSKILLDVKSISSNHGLCRNKSM